MIAFDTNLLVYSYREDSAFHALAVAHMQPVVEGSSPWALPWPCVHEFIGVVTSERVYKPASPLADVLNYLDALLTSPQLHLLAESPGYFDKLRKISTVAKLKGPRIHDARIAAFVCIMACANSGRRIVTSPPFRNSRCATHW